MTALDLGTFKERLLEERRRIASALDYLHVENAGSMEEEVDETHLDNHMAETATVTVDREMDYTLEEHTTQVLSAIDEALGRIEDGTYGTCVTCGKPVGEERLEAKPWANQCIDCRRAEERG